MQMIVVLVLRLAAAFGGGSGISVVGTASLPPRFMGS